MQRTDETWLPLARPLLNRLDGDWRDADEATRSLTFPDMRVYALARLGFVEKRTTLFRRRTQLRLTPAALCSNRRAA